MYHPRLTLGFEAIAPEPEIKSSGLKRTLALSTPTASVAPSIEVLYSDRTVTLRGQVQNDRQKMLCSRLLMFEPGVDAVRNELEVNPALDLIPPGTN